MMQRHAESDEVVGGRLQQCKTASVFIPRSRREKTSKPHPDGRLQQTIGHGVRQAERFLEVLTRAIRQATGIGGNRQRELR